MESLINPLVTASRQIAVDLTGLATNAAVQHLADNWTCAIADNNPLFTDESMAADIDKVIENLAALKLGLTHSSSIMRSTMGLSPLES